MTMPTVDGYAPDAADAGASALDGTALDQTTLEATALRLVLSLHRIVHGLRRARPVTALHPTQVLALVQIAEAAPLRIGELAARVPCSQPTATTVANGLAAAGMVRRVPDTTDGRAIRLELTEQGRANLLDVAQGQAHALVARLASLDAADLALIAAALPVLQRIAAPDAQAPPTVSGGPGAGSADTSTTTGS